MVDAIALKSIDMQIFQQKMFFFFSDFIYKERILVGKF